MKRAKQRSRDRRIRLASSIRRRWALIMTPHDIPPWWEYMLDGKFRAFAKERGHPVTGDIRWQRWPVYLDPSRANPS